MAGSASLRIGGSRAILRLVGDCRDLGDDRQARRGRLIVGLARLVEADLGFSGEMGDCRSLRPRDLGVVDWGWENGFDRDLFIARMAMFHADPAYSPAMNLDFARQARLDGVCHVRETHAALAPLVGGVLAGHDDPSSNALPPGARRILVCLLEGDGDKQIAARLKLSVHTVNGYTKAIFRHFGVVSRTELLARWVRRGWGDRFAWADAP